MIVLLEVPCDRVPVLKHDITKLLLKYILHDLDDVQIAEIMAQNTNLKPKVDCHSVIAQEGLEGFVDDIVDPDTKADVKEEAANYLKHVKAMKLAAIPKAKAKGKAGPAPKKKRCGAKDLMMCELARKYLPQLEACTLSNETEWHTRFRCFYPTLLPPGQTSAMYNEDDDKSKKAAMVFCLAWAWQEHELATDGAEICPWDLTLV